MNFSIIICTRNRKKIIIENLSNLSELVLKPLEIIIVDSSDTRKMQIDDVHASLSSVTKIYHTSPGLTLQRNYGVKLSNFESDYLIFIDDDTLLPNNFLERLDLLLNQHKEIDGLVSIDESLILDNKKLALRNLSRNFFSGKILLNGRNVQHFLLADSLKKVNWIAGYCMTIRRSSLANLCFDENRAGYSMGEDVDVSLKLLSHNRKLFATSKLVVNHLQVNENRYDRVRIELSSFCSKIILSKKFPNKVSYTLVLIENFILYVSLGIISYLTANKFAVGYQKVLVVLTSKRLYLYKNALEFMKSAK